VKVAVLGAGIAGLTAAHRLTQRGHACDVLERWPGLGGQVATLDVGGRDPLERYYHHLFTSDREIVALYDELGMGDAIEWLPSSMAIFAASQSHAFTSPLDLLRFRPLSPLARVRMGAGALALQRLGRDVRPFERITARQLVERWMGPSAWEVVWGPLLRAKFGSRAEQISGGWLWGKLSLRRQIKGREARQEVLGYPRGGWQPLLEQLRDRIEGGGGRVLIDRPAAGLASEGEGRFTVELGAPDSFRRGHDPRQFEGSGSETYDAVVATVPSPVFTALLDDPLADAVGASYLADVSSVEYHTAICLLLRIDRRFSDFYWTNIADGSIPFIGLIEQTNLIDPSRYGGHRFLYVANYVEPGDPLLELDADELLARYTPGLCAVNPHFDRSWVQESWLFREPAAQPVVTVGYRERIPPLRTPVPKLVLANTTQIYPEDRGTNYSVRLGTQAADALTAGPTPTQWLPAASS